MHDCIQVRSAFSWPGNSHIFCSGRVMAGQDCYRAALTLFLLAIPSCLCLILPAWRLWDEEERPQPLAAGVVLLVLSVGLLWRIATSNPGFIPLQNALFSMGPQGVTPLSSLAMTPQKIMEVNVNGALVRLKFCRTCYLLRPPRTSHCGRCGVCVERFDHHCPWVGNCIGRRNYRLFLLFIWVLSLKEAFMCLICVVEIAREVRKQENIAEGVKLRIAEVVLGTYFLGVFCFVGGLFLFHCILVCRNETTYERLSKKWKVRGENPYNTGDCLRNAGQTMCTPRPPARYDLRALVDLTAATIFRSARDRLFKQQIKGVTQEKTVFVSKGSPHFDVTSIHGLVSTRGGSREGCKEESDLAFP